jgi:hypothetical protein
MRLSCRLFCLSLPFLCVLAQAQQTIELLAGGGFEDSLEAWQSPPPSATLDTSAPLAGKASLKLTPMPAPLLSKPIPLPPGIQRLAAAAMSRGDGAAVTLRWSGLQGTLREDVLTPLPPLASGWRRHALPQTIPPPGANTIQLLLHAPAAPAWFDQLSLTATAVRETATAQIFHNLVGYELAAPKRFVVAGTAPAQHATFRILSEDGTPAFEGTLEGGDRVLARNDSDWGAHYWRGDFSSLNTEGAFTVEVTLDALSITSAPFQIGLDLLWGQTFDPVWRAFTHNRCTPQCGIHPQSPGGWHDGTSPDKAANAYYLRGLAQVYRMLRWRLQPEPTSPLHPLADEIRWGADYLLAQPVSADFLRGAALAKAARVLPDNTDYALAAAAEFEAALAADVRGPVQFATAWDLWKGTGEQTYLTRAQELLPEPSAAVAEELVEYEADQEQGIAIFLGMHLEQEADLLLKQTGSPFGVCMADAQTDTYFPSIWGTSLGNSAFILRAGESVARAYRLRPKPEYLVFLYDQLNWILGANPVGQRLLDLETGNIPLGVTALSASEERPHLGTASSSTCVTLQTSLHYLTALANLKRIRL